MPEPDSGARTSSGPEVRAIEQALPRLVATLRPAFEELAAAIESLAPGVPAPPDGAPPAAAVDAPLPELPAPGARDEAMRLALARAFGLRAAAAMAMAMPDLGERARIATETGRLLGGPYVAPLEEDAALDAVRGAARDPLLRDALPRRVEQACALAVRHVLLGGPRPDEADHTPTPADAAGMGRRLVAFLLDFSWVVCLGFAAGFVVQLLGGDLANMNETLLGYVLIAVGGFVNVQLLASTGTTLGKAVMRIGVVRATDGGAPDLELAFRREFIGRFLNQLLFCAGLVVGVFDKLHQTWGDRWAGTVVVRQREPVHWRKWAVVATVMSVLLSVIYLPAIGRLGDLDAELGSLMEVDGVRVLGLTDSLVTLATRAVDTDEEMQRDLDAILALAPSVRAQARTIQQTSTAYHRQSRRLTPWNATMASQIDSVFLLAGRCASSAEDFAIHSQAARRAGPPVARQLERAAQYATSDLLADRDAIRILVGRWGASPAEEGESDE